METKFMLGNADLNQEMIQWAIQCLTSHGYTLKSTQTEIVKDTPWSYVVRLVTPDGYFYLKQTPKMIGLERKIIQILRDQFKVSVPEIIAYNVTFNCFLMKDAGNPLREMLKKKFNVILVCKAIDQFTLMQVATSHHLNAF